MAETAPSPTKQADMCSVKWQETVCTACAGHMSEAPAAWPQHTRVPSQGSWEGNSSGTQISHLSTSALTLACTLPWKGGGIQLPAP